jgi:hypothetical protein
MLLRNGHGKFDQEVVGAKSTLNFHVTLSQANVWEMKIATDNCAKIKHSTEALSIDFYKYDSQVHKINHYVKVK